MWGRPTGKQGLAEGLLREWEHLTPKPPYQGLYLDNKDDLTNAIRCSERHGYERVLVVTIIAADDGYAENKSAGGE